MGVKIVDTALRDGSQSLIATRLTTKEILSCVGEMDQAGYYALEVWGGATFDTCLRFLNEDPWERLRAIRKVCKNTKLQMLFRGQNILGYKHYADDIVEKFVQKSIENGIDIIRVFDALNDIRNLKSAVEATKKYKGHCCQKTTKKKKNRTHIQLCISNSQYRPLGVHTPHVLPDSRRRRYRSPPVI